MKVQLRLDRKMRIIGTNDAGLETYFDTHPDIGGEDTAATPMEIMLQAMGACSYMDVISILRKKRKQVDSLDLTISGNRAATHPKVFENVHLNFVLTSPDAELADLQRATELSQTTYCGASAMFQRSGCNVTWDCEVKRS